PAPVLACGRFRTSAGRVRARCGPAGPKSLMTHGIVSYSTFLPRHRLPREAIAAAWGSTPSPGCKAVCHYDEDSLTMAQAAAWRLLPTGSQPQALYFASTTAPYWQRPPASLIAAWSDLASAVA